MVSHPTSSSSGSCFSGADTVRMESGQIKLISEFEINDHVEAYDSCSKEFVISTVIAIPHEKNDITTTFTTLTIPSGKSIQLTQSHSIPSGTCGSTTLIQLIASKDVIVGNCMMTVDGQEVVTDKEVGLGRGIYTILSVVNIS